MISQQSRAKEILPWYRQKNFKGSLSENEKRILDSFRLEDKHPSASYDDLPKEVRHYISHLEHEVHEARTSKLFFFCAFVSFLGGLMTYDWWKQPSKFMSWQLLPDPWQGLFLVLLILVPWVYWVYEERKLSRSSLPKDDPCGPTNEGIRKEWEVDFISNYQLSQRSREIGS